MLAFELNAISYRGRFWLVYFALLLLAGSAMAHTEKIPKPVEPPKPELLNMPQDNWGGRKAHLIYSAGMGAVGQYAFPRHSWAVFGACTAIGVAKEAYTYKNKPEPGYRHGLFSRNDILADATGCALGVLGVKGIQVYHNGFRLSYTKDF